MVSLEAVMFACGTALGTVFAAACMTASELWNEYFADKKRSQTIKEYEELEIVIDLRPIIEEIDGGRTNE